MYALFDFDYICPSTLVLFWGEFQKLWNLPNESGRTCVLALWLPASWTEKLFITAFWNSIWWDHLLATKAITLMVPDKSQAVASSFFLSPIHSHLSLFFSAPFGVGKGKLARESRSLGRYPSRHRSWTEPSNCHQNPFCFGNGEEEGSQQARAGKGSYKINLFLSITINQESCPICEPPAQASGND